MKPHYVLHKGEPVRVAWIEGKRVGLVRVAPDYSAKDRHCSQCVFYRCSDTALGTSSLEIEVLGLSCVSRPDAVYREFPPA